jgi:uncharacterized membrane protein YkvA (DUF1232 family)
MYTDPKKLATTAIQSIFFKTAQSKAKRYARNSRKLAFLLADVYVKGKTFDGKAGYATFLDQVGTLRRLVRAYRQGDYRQTPWRSILTIIAALIYFVTPLDFIPDFLPVLGFTDDIAVILWVFNTLKADIDNFRAWEMQQFAPLAEQA